MATDPAPPRRSRLYRALRALVFLLIVLALILLGTRVWFHHRMVASLPRLDGQQLLAGLAAPVTIERDGLGVPTIRAGSRLDAVRALGFVHAQDRFFQMDLMRRQSAGELAELVGVGAVRLDQGHRIHRFRSVAREVVARANPADRALLEAYAAGVNAGLAALGDKPFEYIALRTEPAVWKPEDSILAVHAMFMELNDGTGSRESELGELQKMLPPAMFDFLAPRGTEWDAPLVGSAIAQPPIPGPEVMDLRKQASRVSSGALGVLSGEPVDEISAAGSNNFAVAGAHTADGHALLANDMHLGIRVPNTWYRVSIVRPDERGGTLRLTGVTLPGTPIVSVGSNGHVAWGFTNSYGDWTDIVQLELDPQNPRLYRTSQGMKRIEEVKEVLRIKGLPDDSMTVEETIWGPVIGHDRQNHPQVLAWTAHHPEAVNLEIGGLETARTLDEAMAVANRSGIPPQNFTVADESGRVGWTIIGQIPRRVGSDGRFDGRLPTSWADGLRRWDGWLSPEEHPRIVDPPSGRIWTANARVVDGDMLAKIGDGGYMLGARARQIRDDLMALEKATPKDLLAIQLDDRALFLARWRDLLLRTLAPEAVKGHPKRAELRRLVLTTWTGRASIDSVAYRAARTFRGLVRDRVFNLLTRQEGLPESLRLRPSPQLEGGLWRLVTERPVHLLDPRFPSWDAELLASVDELIAQWETEGPKLAGRTWGERNTTHIQHPLSLVVPFLGRWLDMPAHPLPGDEDMPRVQGRGHGASERLVVSPGHEETGIFHMPVGQSGHPLSPYYENGHAAWEEGRPTPFLPGRTMHRMVLRP